MKKKELYIILTVITLFLLGCSRWDESAIGYTYMYDGNYLKSVNVFQKGCELGSASDCERLGFYYIYGKGVKQDKNKAVELFQKACSLSKNSFSCNNPESIYDDNIKINYSNDVRREYILGCGFFQYPKAYYNIGYMYEYGKGVKQDYHEAIISYRRACYHNNMEACDKLVLLSTNGQGVEKNSIEAANLYQEACNKGHAEACNKLGFLYANGQGTKQDDIKAAELYRKACNNENTQACHRFAFLYSYGQGVKKNSIEAAKLYQKACSGGITSACSY